MKTLERHTQWREERRDKRPEKRERQDTEGRDEPVEKGGTDQPKEQDVIQNGEEVVREAMESHTSTCVRPN